MSEHETEWEHKDKMWTYLIFLFLLVGIVVLVNVVWKNPSAVGSSLKSFMGLPGWLLATIMAFVGGLIFWVGLKMEPDWPEAVGAFFVAGAITWLELIVGWSKFDFGGLVVVPYLIPVVVFVLMLVYAVRNSR
jgi:hypothetical protein